MNQLKVFEITTDAIYKNFDHFEQSYSEFSGVSIGNDCDGNYCKGIDYSSLQLPQNHYLKHLIIKYQVKVDRSKEHMMAENSKYGVNSNTNTNHLINHTNTQKPTAILYNSLVPGHDVQDRLEIQAQHSNSSYFAQN